MDADTKGTGGNQKSHQETSLCHPCSVHTATLGSMATHTSSLPAAAEERQERSDLMGKEVVGCKRIYL